MAIKDTPAIPPIPKTEATPSDFLRGIWDQAPGLADGAELRVEMDEHSDAVRAQRWLWRERKRRKAKLLREALTGGTMIDPDEADLWKGLTTSINGNAVVIRRPAKPKSVIVTERDGSRWTLDLKTGKRRRKE